MRRSGGGRFIHHKRCEQGAGCQYLTGCQWSKLRALRRRPGSFNSVCSLVLLLLLLLLHHRLLLQVSPDFRCFLVLQPIPADMTDF